MSGESLDDVQVAALRAIELPVHGMVERDDDLDVEALNAALPHLRRPFAPEAVKWKIQTAFKSGNGAIVVAYIDARLVVERLNAVVGGAWSFDHEFVNVGNKGWALGKTTVFGRTHKDYGEGRDVKAMLSDARKRSAVPFGMGVSIYALAQVMMNVGGGEHELRTRQKWNPETKAKELVPDLDDRARAWLSGKYAKWLEARGERAFGPVLDHGDQADAAGFDEEQAPAERPVEAEDVRPPVEGEEADALRGRIQLAYDAVKARAPRRMLPAEFNRRLEEAGLSLEGLRGMLEQLSAMAREESA